MMNWVAKATVTFLFELILSREFHSRYRTAAADAADLKLTRSHVCLSDTFGIKNRMSVNESAAWLCEKCEEEEMEEEGDAVMETDLRAY